MTIDITTLDSLRPDPALLDPEWSDATLAAILATPTTRPRRRVPKVVAGLAVATVVGTGAAYAGGLVPDFVGAGFDRLDRGSVQQFDVRDVAQIADFTLPDGRRYVVWRGHNRAGGTCEAVGRDWDGESPDQVGFSCFSGESIAQQEDVMFSWAQVPESEGEPQNPMYYVAYGVAPVDSASTVRVTGAGADVTFDVDPVTGGFGGNLPDLQIEPGASRLSYTFLAADGRIVASRSYGPL